MKTKTVNAICVTLILVLLVLALNAMALPTITAPLLTVTTEGGMIPGHDVCMYPTTDLATTMCLNTSYYVDMEFKMSWNHFYFGGGMTAYEWAMRNSRNFYPFRMDYLMGAGFTLGNFTFGWAHGCYHPVLPNATVFPYGKLDAGNDRLFIRGEINKKLW